MVQTSKDGFVVRHAALLPFPLDLIHILYDIYVYFHLALKTPRFRYYKIHYDFFQATKINIGKKALRE